MHSPKLPRRLAPTLSLQADWLCTVAQPPIERGVVEIVDGRISAIHDRPSRDTIDLGTSAILPGLVNAHTHLEFSGLKAPLGPRRPFTDWIRSVVSERRRRRESRPDPIAEGLHECLRGGATAIGEIATAPWPADAVQDARCETIVFRELIGRDDEQAAAQMELAREHLRRPCGSRRITSGLSPHAPYTVAPRLLQQAVAAARAAGAPVAMHVAEIPEEREWLERGTGPLAEFLRSINIASAPLYPRGTRPLDVLSVLAESPRALVIHGNDLDASEHDFLARQPHMTLVYCPRTHARFIHSDYPLPELLARGVTVALGTDSRASNPDLELWREATFVAQQFPEIAESDILRMATLHGARGLGLVATHGTLEAGRPANLVVVRTPPSAAPHPRAIFHPASTVQGVMIEGVWEGVSPRTGQT